jgi:hypothetical protein
MVEDEDHITPKGLQQRLQDIIGGKWKVKETKGKN